MPQVDAFLIILGMAILVVLFALVRTLVKSSSVVVPSPRPAPSEVRPPLAAVAARVEPRRIRPAAPQDAPPIDQGKAAAAIARMVVADRPCTMLEIAGAAIAVPELARRLTVSLLANGLIVPHGRSHDRPAYRPTAEGIAFLRKNHATMELPEVEGWIEKELRRRHLT